MRAGPARYVGLGTAVVLGAAGPEDRVVDVFEGFEHGSLSMQTFAPGPDA